MLKLTTIIVKKKKNYYIPPYRAYFEVEKIVTRNGFELIMTFFKFNLTLKIHFSSMNLENLYFVREHYLVEDVLKYTSNKEYHLTNVFKSDSS